MKDKDRKEFDKNQFIKKYKNKTVRADYNKRLESTDYYEIIRNETFIGIDKPFYFIGEAKAHILKNCNKTNSSILNCRG